MAELQDDGRDVSTSLPLLKSAVQIVCQREELSNDEVLLVKLKELGLQEDPYLSKELRAYRTKLRDDYYSTHNSRCEQRDADRRMPNHESQRDKQTGASMDANDVEADLVGVILPLYR